VAFEKSQIIHFELEWVRQTKMKCRIAVVFLYLVTIMFPTMKYAMAEELLKNPGSEPRYEWYDEPGGAEYKGILPPLEEGKWYWIRYKGIGNIDNTNDLEEVVLVTVQDTSATDYEYEKAFILVCKRENNTLKIKYIVQIYDKAETKAHQYPPFVFGNRPNFDPNNGRFELVDLNNDGILDVFVQLWYSGGSYAPYYVVITSFVDGCFERIFSIRAGLGDFEIKYADIDRDGIYEIEIPNEITVGFEHATDPTWISLYEWNGKEYVLNNKKFYSRDNDVLIQFLQFYCNRLQWYADQILFWGLKTEMYFEDYEFYLGLIYYYKEKPYLARNFLERIVEKAKKEDYIREAKIMKQAVFTQLKKLQETSIHD
jgi:hypothetical protein